MEAVVPHCSWDSSLSFYEGRCVDNRKWNKFAGDWGLEDVWGIEILRYHFSVNTQIEKQIDSIIGCRISRSLWSEDQLIKLIMIDM